MRLRQGLDLTFEEVGIAHIFHVPSQNLPDAEEKEKALKKENKKKTLLIKSVKNTRLMSSIPMMEPGMLPDGGARSAGKRKQQAALARSW